MIVDFLQLNKNLRLIKFNDNENSRFFLVRTVLGVGRGRYVWEQEHE